MHETHASGADEMFPLIFTSGEAARVWGIHRSTVVEWIKAGHCTPIRRMPGAGGYVFSAEEVSRVAKLPKPGGARRRKGHS